MRVHSGEKYQRTIRQTLPGDKNGESIVVDVYDVLDAFGVSQGPRQHTIKKLLCAGIRGKGDERQDLQEAADAIARDIEMADRVT